MKIFKKAIYALSIPIYAGISIFSCFSSPAKAESLLELGLAKPSTVLKISQAFTPPNRGTLRTTTGGATRGSSCGNVKKLIKPLMPQQKLGLTFSDRPTFYFHKTASTGKAAEFFLLDMVGDEDKDIVYEARVNLPDASGIFAYTLPSDAPVLQDGKRYHWYMSVNCGGENSYDLQTIEGWVEKTKPSATMVKQLKNLEARKVPSIYAENGIWHETIASSIQLRCKYPQDAKLMRNWQQLLTSINLQGLAAEPLLNSCNFKK